MWASRCGASVPARHHLTPHLGKLGIATAAALALVAATALPASAASSSVSDPTSDTVKLSVSATATMAAAKVSAKNDPRVDITKVTAKRSAGTLKVTIHLAKLKKGYVDEVAVLVRTKRTKTADSTLLINTKDSSQSLLSSGGASGALPATVTLETRSGVKGAFIVRIPLDVIGSPAKLSVAASTVHVSPVTKSKAISTSDTTGKTTPSSKTVKWTGFLK